MPGFFQNLSFFMRGAVKHWLCTSVLSLVWGGTVIGGGLGEIKAQVDPHKVLGSPSDQSDWDILAFWVAASKFSVCLFSAK